MEKFLIRNVTDNITEELQDVGYDRSYIFEAQNKFKYRNLKIFDVTVAQANILKQTALSVGADCATHREVITGKIENSSCILGGSYSQLKKISQNLKKQPFGLKILGEQIESLLINTLSPIILKNREFNFQTPYIVGILNLGNSFSDGYTDINEAKKQALKLIDDGADIIDIGAESTKPYSEAVKDDEQLDKILPVLEFLKDKNIPISIDTRSSKVAAECLKNGADLINDVSGFDYDENMSDVISKYNCPIIIQHSSSTPDVMQQHTDYENLVDDIFKILSNKVTLARKKGISNVIIDVGIGFGKNIFQNLELLKRIEDFYSLNVPVMVGISRKSFLNMPEADNFTKDIYTLAINAVMMSKKVNFLRVHNVEFHKKLLNIKTLEHNNLSF